MAIAFVTGASVKAASAASNAITTGAITTTGVNCLVVSACGFNGVNPIGNVTDNMSNTFVNLTTHVCNGGNVSGYLAYVLNPTVGAGHTFTFGAIATYPAICVAGFSGVDSYDGTQTGADNITAATAQPGSLTPANADSLVVACANYLDAQTVASITGSGWVLKEAQTSDGTVTHVGASLGYQIQSGAASATNPTFNADGSSPRQFLAIASFKPSSGGATTWGPLLGLQNNRLISVQ